MEHYAGIDVSLEQSSVCVVDATGRIVREAKVPSEPEALVRFFGQLGLPVTRIGLEAGPLSQWLHAGLTEAGLETVLLETRQVKAALSAMVVKTDKKDARGIAQLLRMGWFRPVHCKSPPAQEVRALLVGREVEAICRRYMELRYRLLAYTYTLCRQAHLQGLPLMRPLLLAYPDDPAVKDLANPYLWGPDILVAPVTRAGANRWPVYLPRGTWHDYWTGAVFEGGRAIEVEAPLDRLPLFIGGGAILPLAEVVAGHRPARALQLLVCPQGRSQLTLYDDDGESMAYRTGGFAETTITCDAAASETVIGIERPAGEPSVLPPGRTYALQIRAEAPPKSVTLMDGSPVPWRIEPMDWLVLDPVEGPAGIRIGW